MFSSLETQKAAGISPSGLLRVQVVTLLPADQEPDDHDVEDAEQREREKHSFLLA